MVVRDVTGAGHESAGIVKEIGPGVDNVAVGDRICIEAGVPCGQCEFCLVGRYNACEKVREFTATLPAVIHALNRSPIYAQVVFFSTPPYHGTLTRYHLHPAIWVHKLPDSISFEEGALLEPLAVALAAIERSGLKLGDPLLICGAGPIGLVSLLAARAAGACPIVITDLAASRLEFAKRLVPGVRTVQVERGQSAQELATQVKKAAGLDKGMSITLECTGSEPSIQAAIFSMKFGGTVFVIGVGKDYQSLPFMHMSANEIDIKLQYRYANQYPKGIRLVEAGLIDLKPLVTHRYSLEEAKEAFATAADISRGGTCTLDDGSNTAHDAHEPA